MTINRLIILEGQKLSFYSSTSYYLTTSNYQKAPQCLQCNFFFLTSTLLTQKLACEKDTADGDADLNRGGDDAKRVEILFISGQQTPPSE